MWLLFAELTRLGIVSLPTDERNAALITEKRIDARWAAWADFVRGDLWAESGFTYANLLWTASGNTSELGPLLGQAHDSLDRAARYAPTRSGAWLLLAGLGSRYHWTNLDPIEALRMSYYTGPNDLALMPLRARIAAQLPRLDTDMQQLTRRELHLLVTHQQKSAVIDAYHAATPTGKRAIEQELNETDANFVESLRRGAE